MITSELLSDFLKHDSALQTPFKSIRRHAEVLYTRHLYLSDAKFKKETVIKPSLYNRLTGIFYMTGIVGVMAIVITLLVRNTMPGFVLVGVLALLSFLLFFVVYLLFISRRRNFTMVFNSHGITARYTKLSWDEINDTVIMKMAATSRGHQSYLLLVTNDGRVLKFDLYNFSISDRRLSTIIEYYKSKSAERIAR